MRIAGIILTALIALGMGWPARAENPSRGNPQIRFEGESIDEMIATYMAELNVPGMSLAIVQAPYITRAAGYGFGDPQKKTLVSVNTVFNLADMRRAFTAVAALQLVEDGKLELTDVLPLIRKAGGDSRLEDLVAQASGRTYQEFVRSGQFDRIGLKHTYFGSELAQMAREALTPGERHQRFLHEWRLIAPTEPAAPGGDGAVTAADARAIFSSASDVSIWDIALAGDILVRDPALRKLLYEPATIADVEKAPTSGPWFFPGRPGLMITTGNDAGFSSLLSRFTHRDELLCVTLLANREGLDLSQLARRIAGAHNPKLGPPARARGMRVQQSPWSITETVSRFERTLRESDIAVTAVDPDQGRLETAFGPVSVWVENEQVWIAVADPLKTKTTQPVRSRLEARAAVDRALLRAVMPDDAK